MRWFIAGMSLRIELRIIKNVGGEVRSYIIKSGDEVKRLLVSSHCCSVGM